MTKCPIPWDKKFDKNKKYIWISETGKNTCQECKSLDGKIFTGDKVPLHPHPNCKCDAVEYDENKINSLPPRKPFVKTLGKWEWLASNGANFELSRKKSPDAKELFRIALYGDKNKDYLKNTTKYEKISDLQNPEIEKFIRNWIKNETDKLIGYGMPPVKDCPVYIFHENSDLSQKIVNSKAIDKFLKENKNNIRFFNFVETQPIAFKEEDDMNLYYAIHGASIRGFQFDSKREYFYCRVEDFYNFDPRKSDRPNQVGAELQKNGLLQPYFLIIILKIPVEKLY
ncbi:MAG: hypothetical protein K6C94_06280 [Candidatus Gastranaerophilales bacterium]|nr:hypothetical protein [Candidatus Gastranaerophilales bacterium]